jgi:hypothetical protein
MKVVDLKKELKKRGLDCHGLKAELVQRLTEARAASPRSAQDSAGADGSEVPSHSAAAEDSNTRKLDDEDGGDDDEDEVPAAHPFAATADDSKKRKLDNAAASEDYNTMEWLCSKCNKPFTTKFNLTRHEKKPCRAPTLHVCPGKDGEGCPEEYSTKKKTHYDDHVKVCGNGRGGKREGAGSGGPRVDAGRPEGAAAAVEKGIGPGVDKVRKQHKIPPKPTFDETGCFCVSHCSCDRCSEQKQKTSTLSCAQLATRYCAATNSVMGMPHNDEEKMVLIEKCIYVSDDTKDRLQKEWETEHMADGRPFPACAACGIRNPHHAKQYVYWKLSSLPQCFELSPADIERVESLGETEIFDFQTKPVVVDLKRLVSCFKTQSNRWLHLHPELVDVGDEGSAESGAERGGRGQESAWFCHHCSAAAGNKQIPRMSIAAGIDYGLLSRVKELTPLTEMEKMLVSEVRLYHVVFKLASRFGEPGSESLKGNVIYFPHDGPAAAKSTFKDRVAWVKNVDVRVVLVGAEGERDNLAQRLLKSDVLLARAHVIYNHLKVRNIVDKAMGLPVLELKASETESDDDKDSAGVPTISAIQRLLGDSGSFEKDLVDRARFISTNTVDGAVEAVSQACNDDVANVRDIGADSFSSVGVMSSSSPSEESNEDESQMFALQQALCGVPAEDGPESNANEEADGDETIGSAASTSEVRLPRASDPCSEFSNNGETLMKLFRSVFPLVHQKVVQGEDGVQRTRSMPLTSNGSLTTVQTRHLFLQFTNVAAREFALIYVLANQHQRHEVLRATSVSQKQLERYVEFVSADGFADRLQYASDNPKSKEAKAFMREISPLLIVTGREKPWSQIKRRSFTGALLGLSERHGAPSLFLTVSVDDVHQTGTVRLSFPSASNKGFPAFAGQTDDEEGGAEEEEEESGNQCIAAMLAALRNGGEFVHSEGGVARFSEGALQRLAGENPVATSVTYQAILDAVCEVLVGLPNEQHRKFTSGLLDCVQEGADAERGSQRPGIFGVPVASGMVTEASTRKALHMHMLIWTAASSRLLAQHAHGGSVMQQIAAGLDTQCKARTGYDVHVVYRGQKVMGTPKPRAAFASRLCESTAVESERPHGLYRQSVALSVLGVGTHIHSATCHKPPTGNTGCRSGYFQGHPNDETRIVQVVSKDAPGESLTSDGDPERCSKCISHWNVGVGAGDGNGSVGDKPALKIIKPNKLSTPPRLTEDSKVSETSSEKVGVLVERAFLSE